MLLLSPVILSVFAALGAAACTWGHRPLYGRELVLILIAGLVAMELSLAVIRFGKGRDQASATQAGLGGLMLLMLLMVGLLAGGRFLGVIGAAAVTQWSPLIFLCALVLVAVAAVKTIRQTSPVSRSPGCSDNATRTGSEHV